MSRPSRLLATALAMAALLASGSCLPGFGSIEPSPWCERLVRCWSGSGVQASNYERFEEGGSCWRTSEMATRCDSECREYLDPGDGYLHIACTDIELGPVPEYPPLDPPGPCSAARRLELAGNLHATADLDGDGIMDLVTVSTVTNEIRIRLSDGTGRFSEAVLPAPDNAIELQILDVDGDGHLDVVVLGRPGSAAVISVHRGVGDGTFHDPVYTTGLTGNAMALADFLGDGNIDVILPRPHVDGAYEIAFGRGDGSFSAPVLFTGTHVGFPTPADLDGDGHMDFVYATGEPSAPIGLAINDGTGRFAFGPAGDSILAHPLQLTLRDMDGDGHLDIVASGVLADGETGVTVILWGDGEGGFGDETVIDVLGYPVVAADVDGDGIVDLIVGSAARHGVQVLLGLGDRQFAPAIETQVSGIPIGFLVGDFDGDGAPDLVVPQIFQDVVLTMEIFFACRGDLDLGP
jgi:hypothetical protein